MGSRPLHTCSRCGQVTGGRGPCARCVKRRDAARPTARQRGYDDAWAAYSRAWLARYPWCGQRRDGRLYADDSRCVQEARRVRADCTDHIRAQAAGGARMDPANHQSLCRSCNARKAVRFEGALGRNPGKVGG